MNRSLRIIFLFFSLRVFLIPTVSGSQYSPGQTSSSVKSCTPENPVMGTELNALIPVQPLAAEELATETGQFPLNTATSLVYMQYWFDDYNSPPGVGFVPFGGGLLNVNLPTTGLSLGQHTLFFRFRDQSGEWSSLNSEKFIKSETRVTPDLGLLQWEYWLDDDYEGKRVMVPAIGTTLLLEELDFSDQPPGNHQLHMRFRDNAGRWSSVFSGNVTVLPSRTTNEPQIVQYEYWLNDDYAHKKTVGVTPGQSFTLHGLEMSGFSKGLHLLHIRFKDNAGRWSAVSSGNVMVLPPRTANEPQIVQYEYWFNDNYSQKKAVRVGPGESFSLYSLPLASLPAGLYKVNFRFRDDAGRYSTVISQNIYKIPLRSQEENAIKAYRYWFDEDIEKMVTVPLQTPSVSFLVAKVVESFDFQDGEHSIHYQFQDLEGAWSAVSSLDFKTQLPGTLYGTITDRISGLPLSGVVVNTWNYTSEPSAEDGSYTLKVPLGFGYIVGAYSPKCITQFSGGINITSLQPEVRLDFEMDVPEMQYEVVRNFPDPNPLITSGPQGSLLHRYYKVVNRTDGSPLPYVPVEVSGSNFLKTVKSDKKGIIDIPIHTNEIGAGMPGEQADFTVVSVNGIPLDSPIGFTCKIDYREFSSYFESYNFYKTGLSILTAEAESGLNASLYVDHGTTPSEIEIRRQSYDGLGISLGVGAALAVQFNDVKFGFDVGADAEILKISQLEDKYLFPHTGYDIWDAVAQYILMANSSFSELDISMIRFLTLCQEYYTNQSSLNDAYIGDSKAIGVKGGGSVSAMGGLFNLEETYMASLSVSGDVGLEGIGMHELQYDRIKGETIAGLAFQCKAKIGLEAINKYVIPPIFEEVQDFPESFAVYNLDGTVGFKIEVVRKADTKEFQALNLYFMTGSSKNDTGFENTTRYSITGHDAPDLLKEINENLKHLILLSTTTAAVLPVSFMLDNSTFQNLTDALFKKITEIQNDAQSLYNIDISYYKLRKEIEGIKREIPLNLNIGLESIGKISFRFGIDKGFEEGRFQVTEYGKLIRLKHYPLYKSTSPIPNADITFVEKIQEIIDEIRIGTMIGIVKYIIRGSLKSTASDQDMIFSIGDNGSTIQISETAFPPIDTISVTSWGWYGDSISLKSANTSNPRKQIHAINRQRAEESYGMKFGIGGFFQFEPYGMELPEPAVMTMVYDDAEIAGFDENSLGMYWEDKENKQWVYVGGVVDPQGNTVTASITKLGVYTLAPAMPYGEFGMKALPDSIYADGLSVTTVESDSIYNNDHTLLPDGSLFNVGLSYGTVVTPDADLLTEGIQLPVSGGKLTFQVRSIGRAAISTVKATSIKGSAFGNADITFYDTIPPSAPQILDGTLEGDMASLVWQANPEKDMAGYVIYYDTDTIAPFNGVHTVYGEPSPIVVGIDTVRSVSGLLGDSVYYFAVSAYDVSGNESRRSYFIPGKKDTTGTSVVFSLKAGWNIISFDYLPSNKDIKEIFKTLINEGSLIKVQDEAGNTLEDFGTYGSWVNHIGEIDPGEGYKIKVTRDCQLMLKGFAPPLPEAIPLKAGWNIIGYPRQVEANAKEVVQAMIDRGTLVKVQDEKGNSIEDWGLFGGWQNNIGNFERGKGYKVKVTSDDTLIILNSYSKAAVAVSKNRPPLQYFSPVTYRNGVDHMNINLVGLSSGWLQPGDEMGVFDGELCVGAVNLVPQHLSAKLVSIPVSAADKSVLPGFTEGHPILLKLWKASTGEMVVLEPDILQGSYVFRKNESTFCNVARYNTTGSERIEKGKMEKITIYPNPTTGKVTIIVPSSLRNGMAVEVLNSAGQVVLSRAMDSHIGEIDLSGHGKGIYFVRIVHNSNTITEKLLLR